MHQQSCSKFNACDVSIGLVKTGSFAIISFHPKSCNITLLKSDSTTIDSRGSLGHYLSIYGSKAEI